MRIYRLDPAGFAPLRRRLILILAPLIVVVIGIIGYFTVQLQEPRTIIMPAVMALIFSGVLYHTIRRQQHSWTSWELIATDQGLVKRQIQYPEQEIQWHEIEPVSGYKGSTNYGTIIAVLAVIFGMGLMGAFIISEDPFIVLPAGIMLVGTFILYFIIMYRSTSIDDQTRKGAWVALIPMLMIIMKMITVLSR